MRLSPFPALLVCLALPVRAETARTHSGTPARDPTAADNILGRWDLTALGPRGLGPPTSCANDDRPAAAAAVRARLTEWVRQANANDSEGMREVWAPGLVGWFPRAPIFSDSAAFAAAGLRDTSTSGVRATFELVIDDIVAGGGIVVVHDIWTETRRLSPGKAVRRQIRGSELWRCQPDGRWRIARYVSAPEPWKVER